MDRVTLNQARERVAKCGDSYARLFARADFDAGLYRPQGTDPQGPHKRDEVYIVASGSGTFFCDGERTPFGPGDFLFVSKGAEHRFEDFTDDFATWVVFFGKAPASGD
jgi:mannose-6-phosphate isomerase-like protein (cupin superfamily)